MKLRPWTKGLCLGMGFALVVSPLKALRAEDKPTPPETQLNQEETAIDKAAVPNDTARIQALAKQYSVDPAVVEDLHAKQPGWGGLTIRLSMAENLMKKDPTTYPTMQEAITKVEALRAEGKGYGAIAHELGFKLGPVVSDAKHTRNALRHETHHMDQPPHPEKPMHPDKAMHPEKMPKPEKPPHP